MEKMSLCERIAARARLLASLAPLGSRFQACRSPLHHGADSLKSPKNWRAWEAAPPNRGPGLKPRFAAAAAIASLLLLSGCSSVGLDEEFDLAKEAFKDGKYSQARVHAEKAYEESPFVHKYAALLGWAALKSGDMATAEKMLAELKDTAPGYIETMQLDAWMALTRNQMKEAKLRFSEELGWAMMHKERRYYPVKYLPKDVAFIEDVFADAHYGLALAALADNDQDGAVEHLNASAKVPHYGSYRDVLLALAGVQAGRGQWRQAVDTLQPVIQDPVVRLSALYQLSLLDAGEYALAQQVSNEAALQYPASAFYPAVWALAAAALGDAGLADAAMDRALWLSAAPLDPATLEHAAQRLPHVRQWVLAYGNKLYDGGYFASSRQFLALAPEGDCSNRLRVAWAGHYAGATEAALSAFRKLQRQNCRPRGEAFTGAGVALLTLGRLDEAEQSFERAISADPKYGRARVALGAVAYLRGDYKGAIGLYEASLDKIPQHEPRWSWGSNALNNLGWSYYFTGQYPQAEAVFTRLQAALPAPAPASLTGLGWALFRQGRADEAKAMFEQALALSPGYSQAARGLRALLKAAQPVQG